MVLLEFDRVVDWKLSSATELPTLTTDRRRRVEGGEPVFVDYRSSSKLKGLRADEENEAVLDSKDIIITYNCTKWEPMRYQLMEQFVHICSLPFKECSFLVSDGF